MRARVGLVSGSDATSHVVQWFTRSTESHVVVCFGEWCVSGQLGGARLRRIDAFQRVVFIDVPLEQAQHDVVIGAALAAVGAPYNLAGVVADGLRRLGFPVPVAVMAALTWRRRHRTCAEIVVECYRLVGVDLFPRPGFPWPGAVRTWGFPHGGAVMGVGMAGSDSQIAILDPDSRFETRAWRPPGRRGRVGWPLPGRRSTGRVPAPAQP